ncbi:MAG: protoporphyrinogen oxidase [Paludibacter sp.]|nr:protoporphyrinogen oxidase [Paludibacter sp.]
MKTLQADIVIIGAGLTGLTMAYYLKKAGLKVIVLDKRDRVGGVIHTCNEDGFTYEAGPNTGVISSPELVQLFRDLNLQFEVPGAASKQRWIWKKGKWHALPSGLMSAIKTPLFPLKDKINILGEPFRRKGNDPDETVAALVRRRMGASFLTYAVDPFISGIYAGDPSALVTRFALPKLYALEQQYGSFIKGAVKKSKIPKSELEKQVTKEVFSLKGGLSKLIEALIDNMEEQDFILPVSYVSIDYKAARYYTNFIKEGEEQCISSTKVITTVDGVALPSLLPFLSPGILNQLSGIRYAKVVQVVAGYKHWQGIDIKAFGGLVPSVEKKDVLGILFPSALFENLTPKGGALLSVFMGGMKRPDIIEMPDDEIAGMAINAIMEMMQTDSEPDLIRVFRYERAIAQYEKSSGLRFSAIREVERNYPGLVLAGNIRDGIGMSDRVRQAKTVAEQILAETKV